MLKFRVMQVVDSEFYLTINLIYIYIYYYYYIYIFFESDFLIIIFFNVESDLFSCCIMHYSTHRNKFAGVKGRQLI